VLEKVAASQAKAPESGPAAAPAKAAESGPAAAPAKAQAKAPAKAPGLKPGRYKDKGKEVGGVAVLEHGTVTFSS
jgi:hypothetical protein